MPWALPLLPRSSAMSPGALFAATRVALGTSMSFRGDEKDTMLRYAEAMFKEQPYQDLEFPRPEIAHPELGARTWCSR